nr:MAG TPA: hypothetical protein [Crassvirales sp.]
MIRLQNPIRHQTILLQKNRYRCYSRQALQVHQKSFL